MKKLNIFITLSLAWSMTILVGCAEQEVATPEDGSTDASETTDETSDTPAQENEDTNQDTQVESWRPDGWAYESHSKGADADYDRIFPDDSVQKIEITIAAQQYEEMMECHHKDGTG